MIRRWLANLFWLPYWMFLKLHLWMLRRDVERLARKNLELRRKLDAGH